MSISRKIKQLQQANVKAIRSDKEFMKSRPLEFIVEHTKHQVEQLDEYRMRILRGVKTFAGLSDVNLRVAIHALETQYFTQGDDIIKEGHIGDMFYILEEGEVEIFKRRETKEISAIPLDRMGPPSYFGEQALLTSEYRSATVTAATPIVKCLRMNKETFSTLIANDASNHGVMHKFVIDSVPIFKNFTVLDKQALMQKLVSKLYAAKTYICTQGTTGDVFYILVEGSCAVTVTDSRTHNEIEVSTLYAGDYFGERALIQANNVRTANVIALENVSCMALYKKDFITYFSKIWKTLHSHDDSNGKSVITDRMKCRRISAYDTNNKISIINVQTILNVFSKYISICYYKSLYGRCYQDIIINPHHADDYGSVGSKVLSLNLTRHGGSHFIRQAVASLYSTHTESRGYSDHLLAHCILNIKCKFHQNRLIEWDAVQILQLSRHASFLSVHTLKRVVEADTPNTKIYVILRGAVRLFSTKRNIFSGRNELEYEEDLAPGECFGDEVIDGVFHNSRTAIAMSECDFLVFESNDWKSSKNFRTNILSDDDRYDFLKEIPLFKAWDYVSLYQLASRLDQQCVGKGETIINVGDISPSIGFVYSGRIDVTKNRNALNSLSSIQRGSYLGETGLLNAYLGYTKNRRYTEHHKLVALTRVVLLTVPALKWDILDSHNALKNLHTAYTARLKWRSGRSVISLMEQMQSLELRRATELSKPVLLPLVSSTAYLSDDTNAKHSQLLLPSIEEMPYILNSTYDIDPFLLTGVKRCKREQQRLRHEITLRRGKRKEKRQLQLHKYLDGPGARAGVEGSYSCASSMGSEVSLSSGLASVVESDCMSEISSIDR